MFNPRADGNCGFRAIAFEIHGSEDLYRVVKRTMHQHFNQNLEHMYPKYHVNRDRINRALDPDHDEWFCYPECCQIAADVYKMPVAFFSDLNNAMLFPLKLSPSESTRIRPLSLQLHDQSAHFYLIQFKHGSEIPWPQTDPYREGDTTFHYRDDPWFPLFTQSFLEAHKVVKERRIRQVNGKEEEVYEYIYID